jgi:hypothetical protein
LRQRSFALEVALADVEQVMLVEQLCDPAKLQQVEIEGLQRTVEPCG